MLVDYFISRALAAIQGTDSRVLALIGKNILERALKTEPPAHLMERWKRRMENLTDGYSRVNNLQLRVMYYEAISCALAITESQAQEFAKEGAWAIQSSSIPTGEKTTNPTQKLRTN